MFVRVHRLQPCSVLFFSVALALLCPTLVTAVWAQKDAGAIVGLVRDSSGAVVAGARVTVIDVDRNIQLTLSTNDAGEYVASPLRIGRYRVTVEKPGFKKAVAGPFQVNIQDRVGVDLKLQTGSATETITVTRQSPQLETETSDLGQVVDSRRINALPLNGRNYAQLALLGVGIAAAAPGSRLETTYGFSSNGARSLQNNFLLDGIDNNANLGDVPTPGTLFNTCAFADNTILGTFGDAPRNDIEGPGYITWDTSLVKQFPINEQNVLNHVNYLFGQFGAISAEPTPLELNPTNPQSGFGFPLAARAPRQIQFALKFYFCGEDF